LLAGKMLPFNCSWQRRACQIFQMNNVGFNVDFGNGCATVGKSDRDNITTVLADWPKEFCKLGECLIYWMFSILG
jgi:hypothetical protein